MTTRQESDLERRFDDLEAKFDHLGEDIAQVDGRLNELATKTDVNRLGERLGALEASMSDVSFMLSCLVVVTDDDADEETVEYMKEFRSDLRESLKAVDYRLKIKGRIEGYDYE